MGILFACMYVHHVHAWDMQTSEKGVLTPGTGVLDGSELLSVCWELNSRRLQEQVPLTSEPSLQHRNIITAYL